MTRSDNNPVATPFRGHTSRELYKAIFEADAPEQMVRQLPVQSLFMVVKQVGLESCCDLILMASLEQCRLLTDLDLWHGDNLKEDALWQWLALTDEGDSLEILQKFLKCVDLKLVAILIGKYVETRTFDEPTDQPPGPGFYTPDKGSTWIGINVENENQHFLLARLLAMILETNTELFYQLLATPSVATVSMLEEDSYQDRTKRLAAEGVPEPEVAAAIHAPYSFNEALSDLHERRIEKIIEDVRPVEPLLYEARATRLFAELLRRVDDHEVVEMEFTYLLNAAVVRFGVDFSEHDRVLETCERIKGAINVALEKLVKDSSRTISEVYQVLGLGKLYRLGLTEILSLRGQARKVSLEAAEVLRGKDPVLFSIVACAREPFPCAPACIDDAGGVVENAMGLEVGSRAIEGLQIVSVIRAALERAIMLSSPESNP
jgi:hypothetical protein